MDQALKQAARSGDVSFLIAALAEQPADYFLSQWKGPSDRHAPPGSNIFHIAARNQRAVFVREAIDMLSRKEIPIRGLLSHQEPLNKLRNPLHIAAQMVDLDIVKHILRFYDSTRTDDQASTSADSYQHKPWLAKDASGNNPLQVAMGRWNSEDCAVEMLKMDMETLCKTPDKDGQSPLYVAVSRGLERVALQILTSSYRYSIDVDRDGANPLHMISLCSENVGRLLLKKHADLLDSCTHSGASVLHYWAKHGQIWPLNLLLKGEFPVLKNKVFRHLIKSIDHDACNPLHIAVRYEETEFLRTLIEGYQKEIEEAVEITDSSDRSPLVMKNGDGDTPLHLAITHQLEDIAIYMLSVDPQSCQICNPQGESPLFLAVLNGSEKIVKAILSLQYPRFDMLRRNDGRTVLHALSHLPANEAISRLLIEKFWWLLKLQDTEGMTAKQEATQGGNRTVRLVGLLEDTSLTKERFNWITACETGDVLSFRTLLEHCPDDFQKLCLERKDTPLHHIKLPSYKDCQEFLRLPLIAELKNRLDRKGDTPLHCAVERKDLHMARALLTEDDVERTIKDRNGLTAMDLLAKRCDEDPGWREMCNHIGINPYWRPTYIQPHKTDLGEMRGTLSIVAALLATITFAAGFTLPGGVNSESGQSVLAKKFAFTVFLLADGYAMCTAMLVLFCLIWSMVSNPDMSLLLIDRSVVILMQSLYGTLVAFMTGVYTVVSNKSLWPPIVVIVMCSLIALTANRAVLFMVLSKFVPAASREHKDRFRQLELGRTLTIQRVVSQKGE